jgi:hypothetical protein
VLANDSDDGVGRPDGTPPALEIVGVSGGADGQAAFTKSHVTFRAANGDKGDVSLTYRVSDGSLESTGKVTVHVKAAPPERGVDIRMAKKVVAPRTYRIHGRVQPAEPSPVHVWVQRLDEKGHWKNFARDKVGKDGTYSVRFTPIRNKKESFRAVAKWPNKHHKFSARLNRKVKALAHVVVSGPLGRSQVRYSWRPGCPVPPKRLRKITINRFDYRHNIRRGSVVVAAGQVSDVSQVLRAAFMKRFPIRMMKPTDYFYKGGKRTPQQSDVAAMKANNTSAFNCRPVTGNPYRVSQHSYGNAIDINTVTNPYVTGSRVYPSWARKYLNRKQYRTGMIMRGGVIATQMRHRGWLWGARWAHPDYQHFSSNGG